MPLLPEQTTFRRLQTDAPASLTVFFSVDAQDALGRVTDGPWESITLALTPEEVTVATGIVARFRQAYCDRINNPPQEQTP